MWVLRVYDPDEELAAEHELRDVDQVELTRVLGFMPSAYVSTPLDTDALRQLDQSFAQLRQPGRERWKDRDVFLDFDADPDAEHTSAHDTAWHADVAVR